MKIQTKSNQQEIVDSLTDPSKKQEKFIYLVHGIRPGVSLYPEELKKRIYDLQNPDFYYCASLIGNLPSNDFEGDISQLDTFYKIGLVLKPVPFDIRVAWNCEIGSPFDQESIKKWVSEHDNRILSIYEILSNTKGGYNQLVLNGNPKIQIKGIFYQDSYLKSNLEKFVKDVSLILNKKNIPVVKIGRGICNNETFSDEDYRSFLNYNLEEIAGE